MPSKLDKQDRRIIAILKSKGKSVPEVTDETLKCYLEYLEENLESPCFLTGIEDFPWEEKYVFGYGDEKEYEKLKKKNPSYSDTFKLLAWEPFEPNDDQLYVKVERVSDQKKFTLPLADLEATERKSKNYQLLDDYSVWWVNYRD